MVDKVNQGAYQLQVEVSGDTEDVLDFTLLQPFDDVLCEFHGAHGGG